MVSEIVGHFWPSRRLRVKYACLKCTTTSHESPWLLVTLGKISALERAASLGGVPG